MVTQSPDGMMEFFFYRPEARQVSISGDFNGWQNCFLMNKQSDGWWKCRLRLSPGTYQFRYCADGQWFADYAAFGLERGPYGWNSVVKVEEIQSAPTEQSDDRSSIAA